MSLPSKFFIAAITLLGLATPLRAQPGPDQAKLAEARRALNEGSDLYDRKDHAAALARFEEAYRLVPSARLHFNLGLALRGLGREPEAYRNFARFVTEALNARQEDRAEAREYLDELERRLALLRISAPDCADARVTIDGQFVGRLPLAEATPLEPGDHTLSIEPPGRSPPVVRPLRAVAHTQPELILSCRLVVAAPSDPSTAALLAARPKDQPPPSFWRKPVVWAGIAAVLVAGAATVYLLARDPRCIGNLPCFPVN
jgi:tetratricopeptide (TPR) repeat protein